LEESQSLRKRLDASTNRESAKTVLKDEVARLIEKDVLRPETIKHYGPGKS